MKTTVAEDPTDPNSTFRYGLGLQRVKDTCGVNWGHGGSIFGYQDLAYWNANTGRTVVIATTMSPAPAAAEAPLATATGLALCANTITHRPTASRAAHPAARQEAPSRTEGIRRKLAEPRGPRCDRFRQRQS